MSGSTIGGIAGGVIGFVVTGFNPAGAQWGFMIGSAVGGYLDPVQQEGPRLTDAQAQTSNEGVPRPIIYGTCAIAGNIMQCGPLIEHKKTERASKGGPEVTSYTYTRTVAIRICEAAPLGGTMRLRRVWMDDKLVYDAGSGGGFDADSQKFASMLTFYSGNEDQLPDASLEALPTEYGGGVGNVPAYRGTCYAVLTDLDCTSRQGSVPQFRWEVCSDAVVTPEVCYPSNWIVLGLDTLSDPVMYRSDDLVEWVESDLPGQPMTHIARDGNEILISGTNTAWFSNDNGGSWTKCVGLANNTIVGAVKSKGKWILPTNLYNVNYSDDGVNFTYSDDGSTSKVAANDNLCVRVFVNVSSVSSDGGVTWEYSEAGEFQGSPGNGGIAGSDSFFIVGIGQSATSDSRLRRSSDGLVWEDLISPWPSEQPISNVAYDKIKRRWGISAGRDFAFSDNDGESWTVVPEIIPEGRVGVYGSDGLKGYNGKWVMACQSTSSSGGNEPIAVSMDGGLTWETQIPTGSNDSLSEVNYSENSVTGIKLPDNPNYFLQEDGSIISNCIPATIEPGTIPLASIVGDIAARTGITLDRLELQELLPVQVRGFPIARETSGNAAILELMRVYFFELPEWGNSGDTYTKLRAVMRGGVSLFTLSEDEVIENGQDEFLRPQPSEFPRKLSLTGADPAANYEPATESAERESESYRAMDEQRASTNVILSRDELAVAADKMLKVAVAESSGRIIRTVPSLRFSGYTPSDCLLHSGGRYRIEQATLAENGIEWKMVADSASASKSAASGTLPQTPTAAPSTLRGPTMFAALNLPRLRSKDASPGMYIAVCGRLPGWNGCDLYMSVDGGVSENLIATIFDSSTMGVLTNDFVADTEPLDVSLYNGELDSVTAEQLDSRMNAVAVTTEGISEILQFENAIETSEHSYALTGLRRGLLATIAADHKLDDSFVALNSVVFIPLDISLAGKLLMFRPVSRGTLPENNVVYSVLFEPQFTGPEVISTLTVDSDNITVDGSPIYVVN